MEETRIQNHIDSVILLTIRSHGAHLLTLFFLLPAKLNNERFEFDFVVLVVIAANSSESQFLNSERPID